jgi:hypothetical protein
MQGRGLLSLLLLLLLLPTSRTTEPWEFCTDSDAGDDARIFCNKRNGEIDISGDALIFPDFFSQQIVFFCFQAN